MELNILKARRITTSIDKLLKDLLPPSDDRFAFRDRNENLHFIHDDIESASSIGDEKVKNIFSNYESLVGVKYYLRSLIGEFNASSEIIKLQNLSKRIESENNGLLSITKKYKNPSFNTTNNKFSEGCSSEYIATVKKRIQRNNNEIQNISDKCAEINITNKITISDEYVEVLKNYDLLS